MGFSELLFQQSLRHAFGVWNQFFETAEPLTEFHSATASHVGVITEKDLKTFDPWGETLYSGTKL
jgi:hypothetical protein